MVDCLVLAGSKNTGSLREISTAGYEALITFGHKTMLEYVLCALTESGLVDRLVVVGPEEIKDLLGTPANIELVMPQDSLMDNVAVGLQQIDPKGEKNVLVVTADIPLITVSAIKDFIAQAGEQAADFYYPVVSKEVVEGAFPGGKRTYVTLKDGIFTGGNIALIRPTVFAHCREKAVEFARYRKNPLKLAKLLGPRFVWKFLWRRLSLQEAEKRVSNLFEIEGRVLVSRYPEVAVDVDKPEDYKLLAAKFKVEGA